MAGRVVGGVLVDQVAEAISGFDEVTFHPGFERIELSHRGSVCLGFVEPSGLWLGADDAGGEVHPGRFGRPFVRIAGADDQAACRAAISAAIDSAERGETYAAAPVMQVSTGLYLGLINADAESLAEVAAAVERAPDRGALWRLWESSNWRSHVLAGAAACITGDAAAVDMGWMALDRSSAAAPQIAVTLQRIDPGFEAAARARLEVAGDSDASWRDALAALVGQDAEGEGARATLEWKRSIDRFLAER